MENNMQIINIKGIECYEKNGTAYLKLETVARGLGFTEIAASGNECVKWTRVRKYLSDLGAIDTSVDKLPDFIPESIFYRLAMKAKNETAEKFQAFVATEVFPSIRKHGMYMTEDVVEKILADPDFGIKLLSAYKEERDKNKRLQAENELQRQVIEDFKPIKQYVDVILESKDAIAITQIAQDYGLTAYQLNNILHEEGIQYKVNGQWVLYKEHMGKGYTDSKTYKWENEGWIRTKIHTYWTQKGRLKIHEILAKRGIRPLMDIEND